ncbi:MFS transporter OS=Streptomyces microflavus OX=1919 GN=Smic_23050 PE=4 SV=1 [Streptomyces microflavus]
MAWPAFVADLAEGEELDRWYAFTAAGKNASVGLGGAAGGALLGTGSSGAAVLIVVVNAGTSAITALLFAYPGRGVRTAAAPPPEAAAPKATGGAADESAGDEEGGWRSLLGDRTVFVLIGARTAIVFASLIPTTVLPVYLVAVRGLPPWLPSTAFTLNALLIVVGAVRPHRPAGHGPAQPGGRPERRPTLATLLLLAVLPAAGSAVGVALVFAAVALFTFGQMAATPAMTAAPRPWRPAAPAAATSPSSTSPGRCRPSPGRRSSVPDRGSHPAAVGGAGRPDGAGWSGYHVAGRMAPGAPRGAPGPGHRAGAASRKPTPIADRSRSDTLCRRAHRARSRSWQNAPPRG